MARCYIRNLKITKRPSLQVAPRWERPADCVDQLDHSCLKCHKNTAPLDPKARGVVK